MEESDARERCSINQDTGRFELSEEEPAGLMGGIFFFRSFVFFSHIICLGSPRDESKGYRSSIPLRNEVALTGVT